MKLKISNQIGKIALLTIATIKAFATPLDIGIDLKSITGASTSIYIYDLKNNKDILKENHETFLIPASLQKLYTGYAAINKLGDRYKFITSMSSNEKPENNVLYDNLYINFSGDPTFTSTDLNNMFLNLKVKNIDGDLIIIANQAFDKQVYGPGWMWDELDDCYAAPITSSIIDSNCGSALVWPSEIANTAANFKIEEQIDQPLVANINTSNNFDNKCEIHFSRNSYSYYELNGCIDLKSNVQKIKIAAHNSQTFLKQKIKSILESNSIAFSGSILFQDKAPKNKVLVKHYSDPLSSIITKMLKTSDNLIAESLYKKIGQIETRHKGSWSSGHQAVVKILHSKDIDIDDSQAIDGSGLSRYNLVTAGQIIRLLKTINDDDNYKNILLQSLPTAGIDGTLNWINSTALVGQVKGKTGSMTGVYNLAGYFSTLTSDYAYVILINGKGKQSKIMRAVAEKTLNTAILSL